MGTPQTCKQVDAGDFKNDRLNPEQREGAGIGELSRRRYHKLFRPVAPECGGKLDPDTHVWNEVPLPWEVLSGEVECPRALLAAVCKKHGVKPVKNG